MSTRHHKGRPAAPALADKPEPELEMPATEGNKSGRVKFDARGNAIWEWSVATDSFGRDVSTERLKRLENNTLSLAEDAPTPLDHLKPNPLGTLKGYNPYDSGKLAKAQAAAKKTDLRRLSDWLKLKKQAANNKDEE